jgi:hypothetical protein
MKYRIFFVLFCAVAIACMLPAHAENFEPWVGVWQGQFDGKPGVTVTLGRDTGELQGTIVFNVVDRQEGVIGHDAHVLTHVNLHDSALAFHVIRLGDDRELHLTLKLTSNNKALLECGDCGGPASTELTRIH